MEYKYLHYFEANVDIFQIYVDKFNFELNVERNIYSTFLSNSYIIKIPIKWAFDRRL